MFTASFSNQLYFILTPFSIFLLILCHDMKQRPYNSRVNTTSLVFNSVHTWNLTLIVGCRKHDLKIESRLSKYTTLSLNGQSQLFFTLVKLISTMMIR